MMEKYLETLVARDSQVALPDLEQDIWRRVALRQTSRTLAYCQGAVLAVGVFGSAAIGITVAVATPAEQRPSLALGLEMAPSTLLFGKSQ